MDVTMRTMQSTSVMVNRKLTYKPKDSPTKLSDLNGMSINLYMLFRVEYVLEH